MNDPIPRPMPNEETLTNYHYKSVFDTPAKAEDGKPRKIDYFEPRANIRSQFTEGKLKDLTSITTFSTKFIVEESLVKDYLEHLQNLDLRKQVRTRTAQRKRQAEREKSYGLNDYIKVFYISPYVKQTSEVK